MHTSNQRNFISVEQAARELGVKAVTVRAWAAQRRFTFVKLGRAIRIPASEIDRIIEVNTIPALDNEAGR